ncbi:MAG: four helix bundle protein [Planctomycetota bacterium]
MLEPLRDAETEHEKNRRESRGDAGIRLKERTRKFAVRIVLIYAALPKSVEAQAIGKQVLRSGTSVGTHYHEGQRSRSMAESISKLEGALQELEETVYWLQVLGESEIVPFARLERMLEEADRLAAILTTCVKRMKARRKQT